MKIFEFTAGLIILMLAAFLGYFAYNHNRVSNGYNIIAVFSNVGGIAKGSKVCISGVEVGKVTGIDLNRNTYDAQIDMLINKEISIPKDSSVQIVSDGILGGKHIEISIGASSVALKDGAMVHNTQSSINFESILNKFLFGLRK